jgi:hypothetical protein
MPSKKHESLIVIDNTNIPNGVYRFVVTDWDTNILYESSVQNVVDGEVDFLIDAARGQKCMVGVTPNDFPPEYSAYFGRISDGTVEMFANESLKIGNDFAPTNILLLGGETYTDGNTFNVDGVSVTITSEYSLHVGLNGMYDYLDIGQSETLQIPYTEEESTLGTSIWTDGWDNSLTGYNPNGGGRWVDQGDGWYSTNYSEFPFTRIALLDVDEDDIYEFRLEMRESSLGGSLAGEINFSFVDSNNNVVGQNYQKNIGSDTTAVNRFTVPANAVGFVVDPGSGTRVDFRITTLSRVVPAEISYINVLVKGSEQVSAKLAQTDSLSGTNWVKDGSEYTHTPGQTAPLSVAVATSVGKVIQISCNTKNATAGSITIPNATRDYSTVINDGDVWLVKATNSSFTVNYTPTSDFDGVVYDTFIREVITEVYAANVYDLISVDHPTSGKATLEWKWPIIAPRNSLTETPDNYLTGVLAQSEEFAHRYDNEEQSAVYENATFSGTRSGISLRSGGSWVEVFNVVGVGGFTSQGVIGEPLITEDGFTISGSGFSYLGWGNYNADSDTNDIIRANLTGVEGEKLHITVLKRDTTSGTIIPRLIGDTTTTGSLISSDQLHDTYIITIPANMVRVEYVANGFQGRISRLIVSSLISEFNDSPSDKFQSLFANANRPGPQIDDLRMYYFDFDLFIPPMPDNYGTTNSDGIVLNRGFDTSISYRGTAHMVGGDIKNVSDAGVDGKTDTFFNYGKIFGGHRGFRNHAEAHHVLTNSEVNRHGESEAALFFSTSSERTTVWNLYVDNVRSSSSLQLNNFMNVSPPVVLDSPKGALSGDVQNDSVILQCNVLRTVPKIDPKAKVAMTHMEFEHKLSNASTWQTLDLPLVDLPGFVGNRRRTFDLSPDTYDFRCRCINGEHTGSWATISNQVVN